MSDTEITLVLGNDGDEDGNGWTPRLAVDHDGRHELYVIVGEEVGGMVEGVPPEVFAALAGAAEQLRALDAIHAKALEALKRGEVDVSALWLRDTIDAVRGAV